MLIKNSGPTITMQDLVSIETELGAALPDSYRHFLLKYNGGDPTPDTIDVPGLHGSPTDVRIFFGIGRSIETSNLSWNLSLIRELCPDLHLLPIACDSGGSLFCLKFEAGVATDLVYFDLEAPDCTTHPVAECFDDFVLKLRPFD